MIEAQGLWQGEMRQGPKLQVMMMICRKRADHRSYACCCAALELDEANISEEEGATTRVVCCSAAEGVPCSTSVGCGAAGNAMQSESDTAGDVAREVDVFALAEAEFDLVVSSEYAPLLSFRTRRVFVFRASAVGPNLGGVVSASKVSPVLRGRLKTDTFMHRAT